MTRVVLTGVMISGQDVLDKFFGPENNGQWWSLNTCIEALHPKLTDEQKATLKREALELLREAQ